MDVELSLVIPAYNEARRLPRYLGDVRRQLAASCGSRYEVIVVDDGSSDGSADALTPLGRAWRQLRLLRHPANRGEGAAVRGVRSVDREVDGRDARRPADVFRTADPTVCRCGRGGASPDPG